MTNREFLIEATVILGHLWNPRDMEQSTIAAHLKFAIVDRLCKRYKRADKELDAAWKLTKAMIEKKQEAGF